MTPKEAVKKIVELFPFKGYMSAALERRNTNLNVAETVCRYLQPGARILDFGSGPCDKAAVLQLLGYKCSALDDLQDDWHKLPGNKERIVEFARKSGVDFRLASESSRSFEKESFDMVMLLDVLEHSHDSPRNLLNSLLEMCKPGGYLLVTVPNAVNVRKRVDVCLGKTNYPRYEIFYYYPVPWRGHVREYVRDDLSKLAEYLKVEIMELRGCDHMLGKVPKALQPFYLLFTDFFDGLKDSWTLVVKKPKDWRPHNPSRSDIEAKIGKTTSYQYES